MTGADSATPSRVLLDAGGDVPSSALAGACRPPAVGTHGVPRLLVSSDCEAELDRALKPPYSGFWQWLPDHPILVSEPCRAAVNRGGLAVSMTTKGAYSLHLAAAFTMALAWRLELAEALAFDMEMALQEAVANALVHGNLGISSEPRGDASGFAAYCMRIGDRLAIPSLAARRIDLSAHPVADGVKVTVIDQGGGFDMPRELAREALREDKSGRGLRIIMKLARQVTPLEGGRRLEMVFG